MDELETIASDWLSLISFGNDRFSSDLNSSNSVVVVVELDRLAIHPSILSSASAHLPRRSVRPSVLPRIFGANSRPLLPPLLLRSQSSSLLCLSLSLFLPLSEYGFFPPPLSVWRLLPSLLLCFSLHVLPSLSLLVRSLGWTPSPSFP